MSLALAVTIFGIKFTSVFVAILFWSWMALGAVGFAIVVWCAIRYPREFWKETLLG